MIFLPSVLVTLMVVYYFIVDLQLFSFTERIMSQILDRAALRIQAIILIFDKSNNRRSMIKYIFSVEMPM